MNKTEISKFFGKKKTLLKQFEGHVVGGGIQRYVYVDNNAPVLLVAHIDTIQTPKLTRGNTGAGFDDRLGCFLANQLAKEYPECFDLLLTDYEETGGSTARYFKPSHEYNFVVELDREGSDYVDYGLASDEMTAALEMEGFVKGQGSYSDILELDHLQCSKINLGIGTYNGHGVNSGFNEPVADLQINLLLAFVDHFHNVHFEANGDYQEEDFYLQYLKEQSSDDLLTQQVADYYQWDEYNGDYVE